MQLQQQLCRPLPPSHCPIHHTCRRLHATRVQKPHLPSFRQDDYKASSALRTNSQISIFVLGAEAYTATSDTVSSHTLTIHFLTYLHRLVENIIRINSTLLTCSTAARLLRIRFDSEAALGLNGPPRRQNIQQIKGIAQGPITLLLPGSLASAQAPNNSHTITCAPPISDCEHHIQNTDLVYCSKESVLGWGPFVIPLHLRQRCTQPRSHNKVVRSSRVCKAHISYDRVVLPVSCDVARDYVGGGFPD